MAKAKTIGGKKYGPGCFLVVEDEGKPSTWHLQVKDVEGKPDHRLMGAAHAALLDPNGYRGNRYEGPDKTAAVKALKTMYEAEGMAWPEAREVGNSEIGRLGDGDGAQRVALTVDYDVAAQEVRDAWYELLKEDPLSSGDSFVVAARDDSAIVRIGDDYFLVPYTRDDEGEIAFAPKDQWKQVEQRWVPVTGDAGSEELAQPADGAGDGAPEAGAQHGGGGDEASEGTDVPGATTERLRLDESGSMAPALTEGNAIEGGGGRRMYRAVAIRPGEWKGHKLHCSADVLQRNVHKFNGLASFLNPPAPQPGQHGYPNLELLTGFFSNARWDDAEQAVVGDYAVLPTAPAAFTQLADRIIEIKATGQPAPNVGLSAVPWITVGSERADGLREVRDILSVEQLDVVYRPAAGGELQRIMAAEPASVVNSEPPAAATMEGEMTVDVERAAELLKAQEEAVIETKLAASGLPAEMQVLVRQAIKPGWKMADLDGAISQAKLAWAKAEEKRTVQGVNPVQMTTGVDWIKESLAALLEGRSPANGRPLSGIREAYVQLSGDWEMHGMFHAERVSLANVTATTMANIVADVLNKRVVNSFQTYPRWWAPIVREEDFTSLQSIKWINLGGVGELPTVGEGAAYTELTWDDAKNTTTWSKKGGYLGITLEAMDKDDTQRLRTAPQALAQAAWLTLGKAVSAIFTTATGAGPTLDDTGALFNATAVSTAGGHANLGTSALSYSSWNATKLAMYKQVELNSGERLGALVYPRYLLVPVDLEQTALTVLASEGQPGGANNDINTEAQGDGHDARLAAARRRIIVVPFWTDTNNWATSADPAMYPTLGVGYRYGRTPEIFSVATENSGLMFSNDVMPIKVRWFFAAGVQDFRGLYKQNVG